VSFKGGTGVRVGVGVATIGSGLAVGVVEFPAAGFSFIFNHSVAVQTLGGAVPAFSILGGEKLLHACMDKAMPTLPVILMLFNKRCFDVAFKSISMAVGC
jgi:hypothetical protein